MYWACYRGEAMYVEVTVKQRFFCWNQQKNNNTGEKGIEMVIRFRVRNLESKVVVDSGGSCKGNEIFFGEESLPEHELFCTWGIVSHPLSDLQEISIVELTTCWLRWRCCGSDLLGIGLLYAGLFQFCLCLFWCKGPTLGWHIQGEIGRESYRPMF